MVPTARAP
jgi:hypothetical protein